MRKITAREHRETAAKIAEDRQHPVHVANGEERAYRDSKSFMSFTKGLPHDEANGLVKDAQDPVKLRAAIDNGFTQEFDLNVPLGDRGDDGKGDLIWHFYDKTKNADSPIALQDEDDGVQHRKWEAPTAGFVYDLQGPDAQAVSMPPAPPIVTQNQPDQHSYYGSVTSAHGIRANPELTAEMAEVYWLAMLRDRHVSAFDDLADVNANNTADGVLVPNVGNDADAVEEAVGHLNTLEFYQTARGKHPRRRILDRFADLDRQNAFRGHTPGDRKGPYLSQFMLMGDEHIAKAHAPEDGKLQYGAIRIDMKVRKAKPGRDYMTHWNEWLDVQNGANVGGTQEYDPSPDPATDPSRDAGFRYITTLRDMATYVHFDALYEAYLNACLWMLNAGAPFDPKFRHLLGGTRHTTGFALFGGPHILSLMTEVATRGLKAVRFQKFNNHLRLRPEALAGLVALQDHVETLIADAESDGSLSADQMNQAIADAKALWPSSTAESHVGMLRDALGEPIDPMDATSASLLDKIRARNAAQNTASHTAYLTDSDRSAIARKGNLPLLPMAFPEGSPMHPSYGAGHATVAGACVTILKAFFDEEACLARISNSDHKDHGKVLAVSADEITADRARAATDDDHRGYEPVAFVPDATGSTLLNHAASDGDFLRIGDELNKLAANISIARNMAGVHYYSDYIDSLRMGEEVAIGVLQEQSIMYPKDPFQVSLTSFDGKRVIIGEGEVQCLDPKTGHEYDSKDQIAMNALLREYSSKIRDYEVAADEGKGKDTEAA